MSEPIDIVRTNEPRPPLPPVEREEALSFTNPAEAPAKVATAKAPPRPDDPNPANNDKPASALTKATAHWIHGHREAPKAFWGVPYQYLRSLIAATPYGVSMATTLAAFVWAERKGADLAKGIEKASEGTLTQKFGLRLKQFSSAPAIRTAGLVATSFTLYRGTSKLVKWMTEYLFNPKDSEEQTVEKIKDLPYEAVRKVKEISPAEWNSTPIAAVVLGFVVAIFDKTKAAFGLGKGLTDEAGRSLDWTRANFKQAKAEGRGLKLLKDVITHPNARFLEQAATNTIGYSLFFELGDRLFKDKQIKRGVWPGEPHSTKALKAAPDEFAQGIKNNKDDKQQGKYAESAMEARPDRERYGFFTSEPSVARFVFRRVLPTAIGISAYTAFKFRHAYMLAGDFPFGAEVRSATNELVKAGQAITPKAVLGKAVLEGGATSLFFLIPWVAEPWERAYDKFWEKMEHRAAAKHALPKPASDHLPKPANEPGERPVNEHQQKKYEELLGKLNEKERASGRAA